MLKTRVVYSTYLRKRRKKKKKKFQGAFSQSDNILTLAGEKSYPEPCWHGHKQVQTVLSSLHSSHMNTSPPSTQERCADKTYFTLMEQLAHILHGYNEDLIYSHHLQAAES